MAATNGFLQQQNQALNSLFTALDPKSLILSQFSISDDDDQPQTLQLTTDGFFFERGPRYKAYADLRESRLRAKTMMKSSSSEEDQIEESSILTVKKQVKFQTSSIMTTPPKRSRKSSSILTQSVPDFSSALRKENRKPATPLLPPVVEKSVTPPPAGLKSGRFYGVVGKMGGGSKSANSGGEKRGGGGGGGMMVRKSYANIEELKGLASAARNAINGDNKNGGRVITRGVGSKTVLGYRQF